MRPIISTPIIYAFLCMTLLGSCNKLLDIDAPINTITTDELFVTNKQAEWAIAAVYSKMINGTEYSTTAFRQIAYRNFAAGLSTLLGSQSADELFMAGGISPVAQNKLSIGNSQVITPVWTSAYRTIYDANAAMEGIAASTSSLLTDSVRKQLTGEALVVRAFSHFYLVNFFGDIPLATSSEFQQTASMPRTPVVKVYEQIKADLLKAKTLLNDDLSVGKNERIRINKWFAEALLARVYLYTGDYPSAISSATAVINHTALYNMETDISKVFLANSQEAIWQLKPSTDEPILLNQTPEGMLLYNVPATGGSYVANYEISSQLTDAFEAGDLRKSVWMANPRPSSYVPAKYKTASGQYYTVMRLAELHLIRAEAIVLGTPGAKDNAIADLNILRRRAGVEELGNELTAEQVVEAVAHERRVELFTEWGHRWFDLKRTGKAEDVLSEIAYKQPWEGNYQLLYPVPPNEIAKNTNLVQNPEYESR